ncbi:MAG: hypothetical protein KA354_08650 [Phycisphaerae bacterium]|nr:hypothetical protein [Phycisphaerae bacterium]
MSRTGTTFALPSDPPRRWQAWFVPLVLIALTGLLLADPWPYVSPAGPAAVVPASATDITPVRRPILKPETVVAGMTYRCSECHNLFPSPVETDRPLTQHRAIVLEHGINGRCFNCHNREDRNAFADDRGGPIPFDQPPLLCAKCHGPVYRDWTHGVHGRTNGYWDPELGPMERRKCVECHDPHNPAFQPMQPAPGPNTLRMGDQRSEAEGRGETRNPLLIYRQRLPAGRGDEAKPRGHRP